MSRFGVPVLLVVLSVYGPVSARAESAGPAAIFGRRRSIADFAMSRKNTRKKLRTYVRSFLQRGIQDGLCLNFYRAFRIFVVGGNRAWRDNLRYFAILGLWSYGR